MVKVEVRLYGSLRRYTPQLKIGQPLKLNMRQGSTIRQVLRKLNISRREVKIVIVNGRARSDRYTLQEGDRVAIFPPIAGG